MKDKLEAGGLKVLDVGCGSGYHALKMGEKTEFTQFAYKN